MSKLVKVGDKIRVNMQNAAGTNEPVGAILTVTLSTPDVDCFFTNGSRGGYSDSNYWNFLDSYLVNGAIELVKEEFDTPLPDDLIKALSPRGPSVNFSAFEQQRLSYFAKEATKYNYVRLGPGDKDTFDKILKLIKE